MVVSKRVAKMLSAPALVAEEYPQESRPTRTYQSKSLIAAIKKKRGMKRRAQRIQELRAGEIDLAEEFASLSLGD